MTAPLFLIGAQRSGTTALGHALSVAISEQHGGTFTVNGKLWYLLRRWLTADDLAGRHLRADEIIHALNRRPAQGSGASEWMTAAHGALATAARAVAEGRYRADSEGVLTLARDVAGEASGGKVWGDKYNEYLLDLDFLAAVFPDARWIMLSRHPTEVAASMLSWTGNRPWNPQTAADAEHKWAAWNQRWLDKRGQLDPRRVLELDYADLCSGEAHEELAQFTDLSPATFIDLFSRPRPAVHDRPVGAGAARVWASLRSSVGGATRPPGLSPAVSLAPIKPTDTT